MSRSSEETKSFQAKFGGYGAVILIIFLIIRLNMDYDDIEEQNLQAYWLYAEVALICASVQIGICFIYILHLCFAICIDIEKLTKYATCVFMIMLFCSIMTCIVYMFLLISDNKEVTKFRFVDGTEGTYSYMLQVCCMIKLFVDMFLFSLICFGCISLPFALKEIFCSNEQNTSVPRASSPNKVNTLAVITDLDSQV